MMVETCKRCSRLWRLINEGDPTPWQTKYEEARAELARVTAERDAAEDEAQRLAWERSEAFNQRDEARAALAGGSQ